LVVYRQKLDSSGKIYIRKVLRDSGFGDWIEILPNSKACILYPSRVPIAEVLDSLRVLRQDLQLRAKLTSPVVVAADTSTKDPQA